jgi:hypothetical protein
MDDSVKKCVAVRPPMTDACGETATHLVTFRDGDKAAMCEPCAMYYAQMASSVGAPIKVETLER